MIQPGARRPRLRRLLARFATLLAALLVALGCLELWLDRYLPVDALVQELDPELLARPIPGARSVLVMDAMHGGERIPLRINPQGFRGPPLPATKAGRRIVVYGDSLVMAENVREEESFVTRLASELALALGGPVEAVNAGVSGYGPDQALLKFEREVDALDADLVVLVLCATNDFGDLVRNKLFGLGDDGALVRQDVEFDPRLVADFEARKARAARPAIVRAFSALRRSRAARAQDYDHGHALNPFIPLYLKSARDEWMEAVREKSCRVRNLFKDVYDADLAVQPQSESARHKVALMRAILARWRDAAARHELPLFAVVVPSAVDVDPAFQVRVDPALYPEYEPERLTRTLASLLAESSIPALDLYELFLPADSSALFGGFLDMHWNAAGQALAARATARELAARRLLAD